MRAREQLLSRGRVIEMLSYDPDTGAFVWLQKPCRNILAGARAGQVRPDGHRAINIDGMRFYEHRLAWLIAHGHWPTQHIDHINLDGTDNRLVNLREAAGSDNYGNQGLRKDNTSGAKGVVFWKGKWRARISLRGRTLNIGDYGTKEEATAAYAAAAAEHFGAFARVATAA